MILNQAQAALLLGCTERAIRDWQKLTPGLPFKKITATENEYDASEIVQWYADYRLSQFKKKQTLTTDDKKMAETREALARAELKEIEVAEKNGELVSATDTAIQWTSLILTIRQSLLNMPHQMANSCSDGMTYAEKKQVAQKIIDTFLKLLAESDNERVEKAE